MYFNIIKFGINVLVTILLLKPVISLGNITNYWIVVYHIFGDLHLHYKYIACQYVLMYTKYIVSICHKYPCVTFIIPHIVYKLSIYTTVDKHWRPLITAEVVVMVIRP